VAVDPQFEPILRTAARSFLRGGSYPWQFAHWKLRLDPVFATILRRGWLPDRGNLLDLGCGQGVLLALLAAAREQHRAGQWPQGWPAPPMNLGLHGIERRADRVWMARRALQDGARIEQGDVRDVDFPSCSVVAVLDMLLYLGAADQQRVLERVAGALEPGGLLLVREADAAGGLAYQVTRLIARLSGMGRGGLWPEIHCRAAARWVSDLEALGFAVSAEPMSQGTPFANVLLVARKKAPLQPQTSADKRRSAGAEDRVSRDE
jgi:SAM-dependent methyltransferase